MSIRDEWEAGTDLINDGILMQRIGMAIMRDTMLTHDERAAQWQAMVECWDKEAK